MRGYTIVDADAERGTVAMEFLLHEPSGPASAWARHAAPGQRLAVTRWASTHFTVPEPAPAGYLLIGDAASLPGINAILARIPETATAEVILEIGDERDRDIPVTAHPGASVRWVSRAETAVGDADRSDWYAWVTGEAAMCKGVRARLRDLGFPKGAVHGRAYWTRGKAMGTDRETEAPPPAATKGSWRSGAGARLLAPLKPAFIFAGLLQVVVTLLELSPYLLLAELGRRLLDGGTGLAGLGVLALVLMGSGALLSGLLVLGMHAVDAAFGHRVRRDVIGKLSRLPLGWFTGKGAGRVKKAVEDDAQGLHYLVTHAVLDVVAALVAPLVVLGYLFTVHAGLAAVMLIPLLLFAILTARMVAASTGALSRFTTWEERVAGEAVSHLEGLAVARAYDAGPGRGFGATLAERARFLDGWQRPLSGRKAVVDLVTRPMTSLLLILAAGGALVSAGLMDAPALLPFLLLGVTFGGRLLAAGYGLGALREARDAARRIGLLLTEPEIAEPETPRALTGERHTVRFEDVSFGYDGRGDVVSGVDLELAPGTVTALVGPSGAGKSTLASLLARFHDPRAGRVTVGGVDLRELSAAGLYRTVGFVFQDVALIEGTIAENIALARPDATRAQIEEAARAAGIHERVVSLPGGYDSPARLSGGEAQRVTIARALLADPAVLILDEATAHADPESEHEVQRALARLVAGRTVLVIAHRLHTVTGADAIVVMDGGRVAQRGTHTELLAAPGLYRELWHAARPEGAHA
ncbi:ABC transporter ATP-binding protein [Actinorhabdospora filicis]|uniref:Mycobactin import ATP-binding/permease protein IrtA n=1 Tax=Actinorhabdospora filicis TaxID=1785913 RepID=A0A9W6SIP7_9ACTN|nr:ATP-binding cassette domain-containing protein [Actinorhabdospora filicis]GLZ77804.1 ABC transporter ATP-binding protein [Actinorhabdospora filicis]